MSTDVAVYEQNYENKSFNIKSCNFLISYN